MPSSLIPIEVRRETDKDIAAIHRVVAAAFGQSEEADLVSALRDGGYLYASSVASIADEVVGHAALSIGHIAGRRILVLAPVAVAPAHQRMGAGQAVVRHVLTQADEAVTVLGDPDYYSRFGFEAAEPFGVAAPFPTEPGALQLIRPRDIPGGVIEYPPPFLDV